MKVDYYLVTTIDSDHRLSAESIKEAVKEHIGILPAGEALPDNVRVTGYSKKVLKGDDIDSTLDNMLEQLDEKYGDPDGDFSEPTKAMREAFAVFKKVVIQEYDVLSYETVCSKEVNVEDVLKDEAKGDKLRDRAVDCSSLKHGRV